MRKVTRVVVDYREIGLVGDNGHMVNGPLVIVYRGLERIKSYHNVSVDRVFALSRIANTANSTGKVYLLTHSWGWDFDVL